MPAAASFSHETIALDGEDFQDCEFRDCRLVYSGGKPPAFADCRFERCDWKFDDAAARTLAYLQVLWGVGGKSRVQELIKEITGGGR